MTYDELYEIEKRLALWRAALNVLGSDALEIDHQHAADQGKLYAEIWRLRKELIKACDPVDNPGDIQ
jgi:hypothetical protein